MSEDKVFTVFNTHIEDRGKPPAITNEGSKSHFHSYFEGGCGDQWLFIYNLDTDQGLLYCGDADWEEPKVVSKISDRSYVMTEAEKSWYKACWLSIEERKHLRRDK